MSDILLNRRRLMQRSEAIVFAEEKKIERKGIDISFPQVGDNFEIIFNGVRVSGVDRSQANYLRLYDGNAEIGMIYFYSIGILRHQLGNSGTLSQYYYQRLFTNDENPSNFFKYTNYKFTTNNRVWTYTTQTGLTITRLTYNRYDLVWYIKSIEIKDNGVLVADFRPAYKGGVVKLYDVINNVWES